MVKKKLKIKKLGVENLPTDFDDSNQYNPKNLINSHIGRRKSATGVIKLLKGNGFVSINSTSLLDYFHYNPKLICSALLPIKLLGINQDALNIEVKIAGGGLSGQAEAIQLGLARCFGELNPEHRAILKKEGILTRNAKVKERKKYGLKKARKSSQFSKR